MSRTLAVVAALLFLPACPLLDIEAQVQETCVTYPDIAVAALPPATTTISKSFDVSDLQSFKELTDEGLELSFVRGETRATSGITDFTFVQSAQMSVASGDPDSTLATVTVFECSGGSCAETDNKLDVTSATNADAAPYIASGSLVVTVDLAGTPPATNWSMDVDICMTGSESYER